MASATPTPTPIDPLGADPLDLDLDLRDADRNGIGVIDLAVRIRPVGGRRSSRHTHTRLIAALARIQSTTLAAAELSPSDHPRVGHGPDRS